MASQLAGSCLASRFQRVSSVAPRRCNAALAPRRIRAAAMSGMPAAGGGMSPELKRSIDEFIATNKVVVFMKGDRQNPQCGFSARVVQVLSFMDTKFETVNILTDDRLRSGMKEYSQWPTFPQVYINGEFFGGADIVMQAAQSGELKEALEVAFME